MVSIKDVIFPGITCSKDYYTWTDFSKFIHINLVVNYFPKECHQTIASGWSLFKEIKDAIFPR